MLLPRLCQALCMQPTSDLSRDLTSITTRRDPQRNMITRVSSTENLKVAYLELGSSRRESEACPHAITRHNKVKVTISSVPKDSRRMWSPIRLVVMQQMRDTPVSQSLSLRSLGTPNQHYRAGHSMRSTCLECIQNVVVVVDSCSTSDFSCKNNVLWLLMGHSTAAGNRSIRAPTAHQPKLNTLEQSHLHLLGSKFDMLTRIERPLRKLDMSNANHLISAGWPRFDSSLVAMCQPIAGHLTRVTNDRLNV